MHHPNPSRTIQEMCCSFSQTVSHISHVYRTYCRRVLIVWLWVKRYQVWTQWQSSRSQNVYSPFPTLFLSSTQLASGKVSLKRRQRTVHPPAQAMGQRGKAPCLRNRDGFGRDLGCSVSLSPSKRPHVCILPLRFTQYPPSGLPLVL